MRRRRASALAAGLLVAGVLHCLAYRAEASSAKIRLVTREEQIAEVRSGAVVPSIIASPDSRMAYLVTPKGGSAIAIDGKKGKVYDGIGVGGYGFSPDGQRFMYVAQRETKSIVVIDGVEGKPYDGISGPIFSPDSKHLAYLAVRGEKWLPVVDGMEGKENDGLWSGAELVSVNPTLFRILVRNGLRAIRAEIEVVQE